MKKNKLANILNTPLMVSETFAEHIVTALQSVEKNDHKNMNLQAFFLEFGKDSEGFTKSPIAVLPVLGGLTYRGYSWFFRSTYQDIREGFRTAINDPDIEAIVFDIDSPGGEVAGVFDLVDEIADARGEKPIYAIANEDAYSAAYAIASAADKIFIPRTGNVGSIGVIAVHGDWSKYNEKIGVKYTPIYAGARKNDFSPDEPLSSEAFKIAQKRVKQSYELFINTVAQNRDIPSQKIRNTDAAIYRGQEAIDIGLADELMSWEEAMEKITSTLSKGGNLPMLTNLTKLKSKLEAFLADDAKKKETLAMLAELGLIPKSEAGPNQEDVDKMIEASRAEGKEAGYAEGEKAGREKTTNEAVEIVQICQLVGMSKMAPVLLKENVSVDDARRKVLAARADQSSQVEITSTVSATSTGAPDALLTDAKRRAEATQKH